MHLFLEGPSIDTSTLNACLQERKIPAALESFNKEAYILRAAGDVFPRQVLPIIEQAEREWNWADEIEAHPNRTWQEHQKYGAEWINFGQLKDKTEIWEAKIAQTQKKLESIKKNSAIPFYRGHFQLQKQENYWQLSFSSEQSSGESGITYHFQWFFDSTRAQIETKYFLKQGDEIVSSPYSKPEYDECIFFQNLDFFEIVDFLASNQSEIPERFLADSRKSKSNHLNRKPAPEFPADIILKSEVIPHPSIVEQMRFTSAEKVEQQLENWGISFQRVNFCKGAKELRFFEIRSTETKYFWRVSFPTGAKEVTLLEIPSIEMKYVWGWLKNKLPNWLPFTKKVNHHKEPKGKVSLENSEIEKPEFWVWVKDKNGETEKSRLIAFDEKMGHFSFHFIFGNDENNQMVEYFSTATNSIRTPISLQNCPEDPEILADSVAHIHTQFPEQVGDKIQIGDFSFSLTPEQQATLRSGKLDLLNSHFSPASGGDLRPPQISKKAVFSLLFPAENPSQPTLQSVGVTFQR